MALLHFDCAAKRGGTSSKGKTFLRHWKASAAAAAATAGHMHLGSKRGSDLIPSTYYIPSHIWAISKAEFFLVGFSTAYLRRGWGLVQTFLRAVHTSIFFLLLHPLKRTMLRLCWAFLARGGTCIVPPRMDGGGGGGAYLHHFLYPSHLERQLDFYLFMSTHGVKQARAPTGVTGS